MVPRYTHGYDESVLRSHTWRTAANSAAYLLPHVHRGTSLLDVGCGPGTITVDLARLAAPGRVVGIDPSAAVLERARKAAAESGVAVGFEQGDLYSWQNPGAPFDVVHAHQVLQHVPDPALALRTMGGWCRPGGLVAARDADYAGMFWYPRLTELDEWLELYREVARSNGGEPDAARHMLAWAHAAGFTDVTVTVGTWCYSTDQDRDWWGGLWAARVLGSGLATGALDGGLATHADLERIADGWRRWAVHPDAFFAVPNTEILCRV